MTWCRSIVLGTRTSSYFLLLPAIYLSQAWLTGKITLFVHLCAGRPAGNAERGSFKQARQANRLNFSRSPRRLRAGSGSWQSPLWLSDPKRCGPVRGLGCHERWLRSRLSRTGPQSIFSPNSTECGATRPRTECGAMAPARCRRRFQRTVLFDVRLIPLA
jgi:hypothetical protein